MIIKHQSWAEGVELNLHRPKVFVIKDHNEFFKIQKELINQCNGEQGKFIIYGSEKSISFDSQIEIIPNVYTIDINTRKIVTNLHKSLSKHVILGDQFFEFDEIKNNIKNFLNELRKITLINFEYNDEDIAVEDFLKLYEIKYSDQNLLPSELLIKYIELIKEVMKLKIVIISFALYNLNKDEIDNVIRYCIQNNLLLIFLEREKPIEVSKELDFITMFERCAKIVTCSNRNE